MTTVCRVSKSLSLYSKRLRRNNKNERKHDISGQSNARKTKFNENFSVCTTKLRPMKRLIRRRLQKPKHNYTRRPRVNARQCRAGSKHLRRTSPRHVTERT